MARKVGRMRQVFGDYCSDLPDQIWTGGAGLFSTASKESRLIEKTGPLDSASNLLVGFEKIKHALRRTYADVVENHTMQMAAALSYYLRSVSFSGSNFFICHCGLFAIAGFVQPNSGFNGAFLAG